MICSCVAWILTEPTHMGILAIRVRAVSLVVGDADGLAGRRRGVLQGVIGELRRNLASLTTFASACAFSIGVAPPATLSFLPIQDHQGSGTSLSPRRLKCLRLEILQRLQLSPFLSLAI